MNQFTENYKHMTNGQLFQLAEQLKEMKHSILGILLKKRIQEFEKNNGIRIVSLYERVAKLQREYFVVDEKNNFKRVGEPGKETNLLQIGKTMDGFNMNFELIMKEIVNVVI